MSKLEQAARQALEALEEWKSEYNCNDDDEAITALREALDHSGEATDMTGCDYCNNPLFAGRKCNNCGREAEQQEQEPVAWMDSDKWFTRNYDAAKDRGGDWVPLYAAPVRTKDLTDDEIYSVVANLGFAQLSPIEVARAVIAADREKNK